MKQTIMALVAVPAVLLAGGGVAVAQAAGAPAGPAVVQQADVHHSGGACRQYQMAPVNVTARHDHLGCAGQGSCDRGHAADHQGAGGMMTRAHHGDDCGDG